jgi:hypothetical protein
VFPPRPLDDKWRGVAADVTPLFPDAQNGLTAVGVEVKPCLQQRRQALMHKGGAFV